MTDQPDLSSTFVASMTTRIYRHAAAYEDKITDHFAGLDGRDRQPREDRLLDSFNTHVETVVASYEPPGIRRRGDSLVFADLYAATREPHTDEAEHGTIPVEFLAALLAAEVEYRGPLRLSGTQNTMLAEVYERLGDCMRSTGLPGHAALAFRRAGGLHRQNEDDDDADRCGLAQARARFEALPPGLRRTGGYVSDLLCGYGYQPFRLLAWMALLLVAFTLVISFLAGVEIPSTFYLCLMNFLNPVGVGDTKDIGGFGQTLLVVEAYVGTVSTSVFFALLVRRWFRL
ncbi:hypothetical protein ACLMAJ_00130 [Nocardia sp. KC 131]|uniref:hypothetical protein n=1 Tax=Nocardia arseniciresistens TaxID=3392119 RepID=UPI00398ED66E